MSERVDVIAVRRCRRRGYELLDQHGKYVGTYRGGGGCWQGAVLLAGQTSLLPARKEASP